MSGFVIVTIVSLIFSAFFSGMEIAFLSANKLRLKLDKKQGKFYTKFTTIFMNYPSNYISTMLIGNNIALVVYGISFAKILNQPIRDVLQTDSAGLVLIIQTIISTLLVLITAEFIPKTVCKINPNGVLRYFSWLAFFFYIILYPISWFTSHLARLFLKLLGKKIDKKAQETIFNHADLVKLTAEVEDLDEENEHDIKIFKNALDFPSIKVRECMTPRTEITAIEQNDSISTLRQKFIDSGYSRIPVFKENIDDIIGYINAKDIFNKNLDIKTGVRQIQFVPESMLAERLLKTFIKENKSLAVVVDEFGGTAGIVSIEDILEEIFGEIADEHDSHGLIKKQIDEDTFVLSGRLEVQELNAEYDLNIPELEEYETIAGYILFSNENIPKSGDLIDIDSFRFHILKSSGSRIDLVKLKKISSK